MIGTLLHTVASRVAVERPSASRGMWSGGQLAGSGRPRGDGLHRSDELSEWLTGHGVTINDSRYHVEKSLGQRSDRSFALMATKLGSGDEVVIRIFDRESKIRDVMMRRSELMKHTAGVAAYTDRGTFSVGHASLKHVKGGLVLHALVRPYAQYTLGQLPKEAISLSGNMVARLLNDLVSGLSNLHRANLIHGGVQPSNILLDVDVDVECRLADYGLAEDSDSFIASDFTAPEELSWPSKRTKAGDIWALGKVGRLLLEDWSQGMSPVVRERLEWAIRECLVTDPRTRPTIAEVAAMIDDARKISRASFPALVPAALADLDAREPRDLRNRDRRTTALAVAHRAAQELDGESRKWQSYRLRELDNAARVHMLVTRVFMSFAGEDILTTRSNLYRVEFSMVHPESHDWSNASLDPLWMASIEEQCRPLTEEERLVVYELGERIPDIDRRRMLGEDPPDALDVESNVNQALEVRNELLAMDTYIRSEDVAALMSPTCPGITTDEVRILRDLGYLLSVSFDNVKVYPVFQFSRLGSPDSSIKTVNDRIGGPGLTPWAVVAWWFGPNSLLGGETPADHLRARLDSADIISALDRRFVA